MLAHMCRARDERTSHLRWISINIKRAHCSVRRRTMFAYSMHAAATAALHTVIIIYLINVTAQAASEAKSHFYLILLCDASFGSPAESGHAKLENTENAMAMRKSFVVDFCCYIDKYRDSFG